MQISIASRASFLYPFTTLLRIQMEEQSREDIEIFTLTRLEVIICSDEPKSLTTQQGEDPYCLLAHDDAARSQGLSLRVRVVTEEGIPRLKVEITNKWLALGYPHGEVFGTGSGFFCLQIHAKAP